MRIGRKQVFLPSNMITFLAPRENQLPIFATFKVPRTFNKFDLRDYLLHAYNTPVVAVRSQLRQQPIRPAKVKGRIYRPPPIKTMTVQLRQPFVWPSAPTDLMPWKDSGTSKMVAEKKLRRYLTNRHRAKAIVPLRDEYKEDLARKNLRGEATRLLKEGGWTHKRELDLRFKEKSKRKQVGKPVGAGK